MAFSQIKGHKRQIDFLVNSFRNERLAQSYLFLGKEGIGKKLIAKNFAKLLNCKEEGSLDCCDECISCGKIERVLHPDVFYLKPDETNSLKIEQVRDLKWFFSLLPYEVGYKIAIIEDTELLTAEAANSLLKILEEPPKFALLILICKSIDKLLPTIVSRCQVIRFNSLASDELSSILCNDYNFSQGDAIIFANYSAGSLGKTLRLKEENFLPLRNNIVSNFLFKKGELIEKELLNVSKNNKDFKKIIFILLVIFRDILMLKAEKRDYLVNIDYAQEIERYLGDLDREKIFLILDKILEIYNLIDKNINKRLIIEGLLSYITQTITD